MILNVSQTFDFFSILLLTAFYEVGGYSALIEGYRSALPSISSSPDLQHLNISAHCYTPREDAFHLLRDPVSGDLPWPGVLFGIAIVGGWYWCTDQVNCDSHHSFCPRFSVLIYGFVLDSFFSINIQKAGFHQLFINLDK